MANFYTLTMVLADEMDRRTRKEIEIPASIALADLPATASALIADFLACTKLGFISANITLPLGISTTVADVGSNTDVGCTLKCQLDKLGNPGAVLKIPDPIEAMIGPYGQIDLTQANLSTLLDHYTGALVDALLSDGDAVQVFTSGTLNAR